MSVRSDEDIIRAAGKLDGVYGKRNKRYLNAYYAYRGEYDKIADGYSHNSDGQDIRRKSGEYVQIWNLIVPIVDTHRILLNRLPQITVPSAVLGEEKADDAAEKIEKIDYALWDKSQMTRRHGEGCDNLAKYNSTVWFVRWDMELDLPIITLRQPSETYPVEKHGGGDLAYCIFQWDEEPDVLYESYPEMRELLGKDAARRSGKIKVIEYVDSDNYRVIISGRGKSLNARNGDHGLGKCPVVITPASFVPKELFPPGPIDQLVAMNDYLNRFQTKWGDALEGVMWPSHIIKGEGNESVVWDPTPGALNRLPEGVDYVQQASPTLPTEIFVHLERIEKLMRRVAQFPESASGEMSASMQTGKAIGRLQGVMTGMAAETQANLAMGLGDVNRLCLMMLDKYRPKKKYLLRSSEPITAMTAPSRPGPFTVEFVPEEHIGGYYENQLYYSPFGSDMMTSLTMGMQLVGSDLVSKNWLMNQIPGVGDAVGMQKQIDQEKQSQMELEMKLQNQAQKEMAKFQQELQMEQAQQQAELQAQAQGGAPAAGGGEAPPAGGGQAPPAGVSAATEGQAGMANTTVLPMGQPSVMGTGEPLSGEESFPLPFTNVEPYAQGLEAIQAAQAQGGAPQAAMGEAGQPNLQGEAKPGKTVVTKEEVAAALAGAANRKGEKAAGKLKGAVYLVGEIAQRGWTDGQIEFAIEIKSDQQIITNALPQWASKGLLSFSMIEPGVVPEGAFPIKEA